MKLGRLRMDQVGHVLAKELCEARRDRNLLINVIFVPLFLYPVLGFLFFQVFQVMQGMSEREVTRIALDPRVPAAVLDSLGVRDGLALAELRADLSGPDGELSAEVFRAYRDAGAPDSTVETALVWEPGGSTPAATILFDRSRERSTGARDALVEVLDDWKRERTLETLTQVGLGEDALDVWNVEDENIASAEQRGQEILSMALPMILLLMLAQGTFYAALDAVVGERERGTLETLLSTPLLRGETMLGKFLFVVLSSVVALVLNLASLTLFFGFLLDVMGVGDEIRVTLAPQAVLLIVVTAVLTGGLIAAVLMVLATPARTYREGQATLTPAYLVVMVPGLLVTFQRGTFGMEQAAVPILNSVYLFKSAIRGEMPVGPILMTFAVLAALTAAALAFASRLLAREDVWLDPKLSLRRLLTGRGGGDA